jgi:hypothetical protein
MAEALVVLGVVGLLVTLGLMAVLLPIETLVLAGAACIVIGFLLGVPAGTYYHVKLYRCLAARGGVPQDFFWHPTRYHEALPRAESRKFMPWFIAGAVGFILILLGCSIVMLGVLRA